MQASTPLSSLLIQVLQPESSQWHVSKRSPSRSSSTVAPAIVPHESSASSCSSCSASSVEHVEIELPPSDHDAQAEAMEQEETTESIAPVPQAEVPLPPPLQVAFPSTPIDRYGFLISDKRYNKADATARRHDIWLENRRTHKWVAMIGKELEDWQICQLKNAAKLKKRIRKGIPDALRGRVWCHLSGSTQMMSNSRGMYYELLQKPVCACEETIARDIGRTFPKHYLFHDRTSLGQHALLNVLKAYSLHDPEVGYCQGMGFLSAMFLSYMPEEQAFWHLVACLNQKRYDLANVYRPRMPKVPEVIYMFEKLLQQYMPQLAKHLENEGLHPTMYLSQWFITLFTYSFPFEFVTRVWDIYLHEGWKIIFRVALALMKLSQKTLLTLKFEAMMEFFRELPMTVTTNDVLQCAWKFPLKRAQLEQLRDEYQQSMTK